MSLATIIRELAAAAAVTGTDLSEPALAVMAEELSQYRPDVAVAAIRKARREVRRLTLPEILERIDHADGHPAADEAWALVPVDEDDSTVWTEQIAEAAGVAQPLIARGDLIAARLAFRDAYTRLVDRARDEKRPPVWTPSLGRDARRRDGAIRKAVDAGRLPAARAVAYLPAPEASPAVLGAVAGLAVLCGGPPAESKVDDDEIRRRIERLRSILCEKPGGANAGR